MSRDGTVKHVLARSLSEIFLQHFDLFHACCYLNQHSWNNTGESTLYSKHESLVYNEARWNSCCRKQTRKSSSFQSYKTCSKFLSYETCKFPERQWPLEMLSALYDGSRCHKIRQVVNWRANKQQDLETIELHLYGLGPCFYRGLAEGWHRS